MFPDQQNQNGGQPASGRPQQPAYQQPQYGVNSTPQQEANGQYAVVPPLPIANNTGHSGHNPYEFIVNPNTPKQHHSLFGAGNSFLIRIAMIVGGVVVLMIIAAVVLSALGPKSITPGMTAIAQRQQEIIRIATAATTQASGQDTKNFVSNVELTTTSSQQQILGYLQQHSTKLNSASLALDQNPQTDTLLTNAASAGNYDSAVNQTLSSQLQTYESLLQTTYKQTSSKTSRQLLQQCYSSAVTLLKQAQSISNPS